MLSVQDKHTMQKDMENVIISFGKTMTIFRSTPVNRGSFAGPHKTGEITIGNYNIEERLLSPKSLTEIGADKIINCVSGVDIAEGDRVGIEGKSYIVTHILPQNAFGVMTHLEVNLEKDDSHL